MIEKKGFILYFDVLGYRNIVNDKKLYSEYKKILDCFSEIQGKRNFLIAFNNEYSINKNRLLMRCFSDNFLFVYENREFGECDNSIKKLNYFKTLNTMKMIASMIQVQFLKLGILTRGSLSFGEISYNTKIVYGNDLVHAVELEENHKEPSIVVDKMFQKLYVELCDDDSRFYGIYEHEDYVCPFKFLHSEKKNHDEIINGIKKWLEYYDEYGKNAMEIGEKMDWMIEEMNNYFNYQNAKKYKRDVKQLL